MMNYDEVLEDCLREMFRRVGLRYVEKFCKRDNWYRARSWTESQEHEFKEWMVGFLRKRCRWTKKTAEKEAGMFLLNYGWRFAPSGCLAVSREWRCGRRT